MEVDMEFKDKVRNARLALNMSQAQLAEKTGISLRTIVKYENGDWKPKRTGNINALADALLVTTTYLQNDDSTDPQDNIESEIFMNKVSHTYGTKAKKQADEILEQANAFFAGGDYDEEAKEKLIHSLMESYLSSKKEATEKYGSRKKKTEKSYN